MWLKHNIQYFEFSKINKTGLSRCWISFIYIFYYTLSCKGIETEKESNYLIFPNRGQLTDLHYFLSLIFQLYMPNKLSLCTKFDLSSDTCTSTLHISLFPIKHNDMRKCVRNEMYFITVKRRNKLVFRWPYIEDLKFDQPLENDSTKVQVIIKGNDKILLSLLCRLPIIINSP